MEFFENAIKSGCLSHAYCLVGQEQVGKRTLAKILASQILDTNISKLTSHPDYYYLERMEDEKTGKLKKEISIAQARDLKTHLIGKSWTGGYKVVVADEAELLNEESSNALLKTLEEPKAKTIFFLLTENDAGMIATIKSRCEIFYLNLVAPSEIQTALEQAGASSGDAKKIASIAWGRPGRALNFLRDDETRNKYIQEVARWEKIIGRPFHEKLKNIENLFGNKTDHTDHTRERGKLQKILDIWMMLWRDALLYKTGSEHMTHSGMVDFEGKIKNMPAEKILEIIEGLQEARKLLGQNIHTKILIEQNILIM
ncbi:hypothetical protein KKA13_03885 [Patescibacteria group bacterium]|nr:hypothetical protein [Patescibacteria group bacterium]